jgi:hypothetical protein
MKRKVTSLVLIVGLAISATNPSNAAIKSYEARSSSDPEIDMFSCLNEGGISRIDGTWHLCTLINGKKVRVPQPDNFPEIRQAKLDMDQLYIKVDKLRVSLNSNLKANLISRTSSIRDFEQKLVTFRTVYQNKSPNAETVLAAKNDYNSLEESSSKLLITFAAGKEVRNLPIDYADTTGPEMLKIRVDKNELNVRKKAVTVKITMTVVDDLNSIDGVNIYFSRLDANGKITGSKLFSSKKYVKKSSNKIEGRVEEVFEMTTTFPKGLAGGKYQLLTGDFRDLAGNRRTDSSTDNSAYESLPVISVS